jgi:cytochrome c-type biogenesis protein
MPDIAGLGVASVFLAGLVSFLSPCVLPLVPGYVSFVAGRSLDGLVEERTAQDRLADIGLSLCFVAGFSAVFIAFGAAASALGSLLMSYRYEANLVAGVVIVLFGLHMLGLLRLGWLNREFRASPRLPGGRPVGAFGLGSAFAFGWTPCIGPILGTILALSATTTGVSDGIALLSIYSLGLAVPFLLVAAFTGPFMARIKTLRRLGRPLQAVAGGILVLMGVAVASGQLNRFGTWMLNTFPIFQEVVL